MVGDTFIKASDRATLEKKLALSGTKRENYWPEGQGEHEISFAFNLFKGVLLFYSDHVAEHKKLGTDPLDRDAWKKKFAAPSWLTGSFDWVHWGTDKTEPWIDDLKTGRWPVDPKKSKQLRSYLMITWVKMGVPLDWRGVITVTQWAKYPLPDKPKRSRAWFTGLDMLCHLEELKYAAEHPDEVNVIPDVIDPETGYVTEMSPCVFCDCREPAPWTPWMQHYRNRAFPQCFKGIISTIDFTKPLPKSQRV